LGLPDKAPPVRQLSALRSTAGMAVIQRGEGIYWESCRYCHGKDVVARSGGSVPDLRFASAETHAAWDAIVIGGARSVNGMPGSEMSPEDAEAVRQYVLSKTDELRERLRR